MCALFFEISAPGESEESSYYFWDEVVENVWVGIFSALLSIPMIFVIALAFHVPARIRKSFKNATSL